MDKKITSHDVIKTLIEQLGGIGAIIERLGKNLSDTKGKYIIAQEHGDNKSSQNKDIANTVLEVQELVVLLTNIVIKEFNEHPDDKELLFELI